MIGVFIVIVTRIEILPIRTNRLKRLGADHVGVDFIESSFMSEPVLTPGERVEPRLRVQASARLCFCWQHQTVKVIPGPHEGVIFDLSQDEGRAAVVFEIEILAENGPDAGAYTLSAFFLKAVKESNTLNGPINTFLQPFLEGLGFNWAVIAAKVPGDTLRDVLTILREQATVG